MKDTIICHHSANSSKDDQFSSIYAYHNSGANGKIRPNRGMAYHFVIERSGKIVRAHDDDFICDNSGNWMMNKRSIAICLAGDFTKEQPTKEQIVSLASLLAQVQTHHGIADNRVLLHSEVTPHHTECPAIDLRALAFSHRNIQMKERIPQLQAAIKRTRGTRQVMLRRLLDRLQKLFPNSTPRV